MYSLKQFGSLTVCFLFHTGVHCTPEEIHTLPSLLRLDSPLLLPSPPCSRCRMKNVTPLDHQPCRDSRRARAPSVPHHFSSMSVGKNKRWGCRRWLLIRWHLNTRWFLLSPLCPCVSEQNTEHKLIPLCKPGASACTSVEGSTHAGLA